MILFNVIFKVRNLLYLVKYFTHANTHSDATEENIIKITDIMSFTSTC